MSEIIMDNRIPKEQGKGIIKKSDRIQRHGKIEITHTKTTKRRGTQTQQSTEKKIHMNKMTPKLKHSMNC